MDNKIFRVNGVGLPMLKACVKLAMDNFDGLLNYTGKFWSEDTENGLIVYWADPCKDNVNGNPSVHRFMNGMNSEELAVQIHSWIKSDFASTVELDQWCTDYNDGDVTTELGWLVYVEDWGHVGNSPYALFGVKPAYAWCGK